MHENKHEGPRNEIIKLLAVAAMTVDHIGAFLFPQYQILRIIGRFAMPVFAYGTAMGIIRSNNREKYLARLFIFALISQVPYELVGLKGLSVIATIFTTALFLYLIKKNTALSYILSLIPLAISIFVPMDYGAYFLALSFVIYIFKDRMTAAFISGSLITVFMSLVYYGNPIQIYSVIGLFSACFQGSRLIAGKLPVIRLNKYFFYIYYPLHLLIIFLIKIY